MRWQHCILAFLFVTFGLGAEDDFGDGARFHQIALSVRDELSHRDLLRSYQTSIRLLGCGQEYRENHECLSVYSHALDAALEEWGSATRPEVESFEGVLKVGQDLHTVHFKGEDDFEAIAQDLCSNAPNNSRRDEAFQDCLGDVREQLTEESQRIADAKEAVAPPRRIPPELLEDFTDGGLTPILDWYRDDSYATYYKSYPRPFLLVMEGMVEQRRPGTNYPFVDRELYALLDAPGSEVAALLQGAVVGVIGSAVPWYEVLALQYGAAEAITIEYNRVSYQDHRIRAMLPDEYWALGDARPRFDVALSISSFEHDGLGRYGDPLNPFGDFEAMAEMESMLKPGGLVLLAVPVGWEAIVWNCHRIYGRGRLSQLLSRWTVHSIHGMYEGIFEKRTFVPDQPLFVLSNTRPPVPLDFFQDDLQAQLQPLT